MGQANLTRKEWDALIECARFFCVQRRTDPQTRYVEGALRKLICITQHSSAYKALEEE